MERAASDETSRGLTFGLAAYGYWALVFPLQLTWLNATADDALTSDKLDWSAEVLAHRLLWTFGLCALLTAWRRRGAMFRQALGTPAIRNRLLITALLITLNWLVFLIALARGELYRAGIGYFLTPMVQIALGVLFLGETIPRSRRSALGLSAIGVAILLFLGGDWPWIELTLALSFGCYGLVRKRAATGPIVGLTIESLALLPIAIGFLALLGLGHGAGGRPSALGSGDPATIGLLILTGVGTAMPLLWFAAAAARLPLGTIGLLQFIAPTGQFLLSVLAFGERPNDPRAWWGYGLIFLAVLALVADLARSMRTYAVRAPSPRDTR